MKHGLLNVALIVLNIIVSALVAGVVLFYAGPLVVDEYFDASKLGETIVKESDDQVIDAVSAVSPAVVSVIATKDLTDIYDRESKQFLQDPFDSRFRPQGPQGQAQPRPSTSQRSGNAPIAESSSARNVQATQERSQTVEVGGGTGVILDAEGYILTNQHVISDRNLDYSVFTVEGTEYSARVIAISAETDLALLKIQTDVDLPIAVFGNSDEVVVGQTVLAIGNSLNRYDNTVTRGVVSALGRSLLASDSEGNVVELDYVMQTDASINPGNSGGPLLNLYGEVIGINTAIDAEGESIGFSIPINEAKRFILDELGLAM
jgi:S1-C subfamily serine protease